MSAVYHSAPNKQYLDNICDTIPLGNSSSISVTALPYITWGFIQDLKNRKEGIPKLFVTELPSGISKIKEDRSQLSNLLPNC